MQRVESRLSLPSARAQAVALAAANAERTMITAIAVIATTGLAGCSRSSSPSPTTPSAATDPVVAQWGTEKFEASKVDALVAGPLLELDHQRYLVRRDAIERELLRRLTAPGAAHRTATIALEPPLPPRMDMTGRPAAVRPETEAPVTLEVFCNFESPHCAWVQQMLADLARMHAGAVRVAARDLPMSIHPHSQAAAEAARCAGQQGRYWAFHDLLRARAATPDRAELESVAAAVGVSMQEFQACLDSHSQAAAVRADVTLAQRLGVNAVPAVFVNGRAAPLPLGMDLLMWLVEWELARAGAARTDGKREEPKVLGPTRLPLTLVATVVAAPGLGVAVLRDSRDAAQTRLLREGETVAPGVLLRRVRTDGIDLQREDAIETLSFGQRAIEQDGAASAKSVAGAAELEKSATTAEESPPVFGRGPSSVPVFLDREVVRERMADRVELARAFEPVTHTLDGYRLLKLTAIEPGSLYELPGLQAGDVIIMVNEQPIHEGDIPLWDALDREDEVRVRVMRRGGLATQYVYRFK
jgi:protein-disulfide isomerase